jgi:hypothetical protein
LQESTLCVGQFNFLFVAPSFPNTSLDETQLSAVEAANTWESEGSKTFSTSRLRRLVHDTIRRIESAQFLPHSGIRFPQNPCSTCPYVGLCLNKPQLVENRLIRRPGAEDFGVFDELTY